MYAYIYISHTLEGMSLSEQSPYHRPNASLYNAARSSNTGGLVGVWASLGNLAASLASSCGLGPWVATGQALFLAFPWEDAEGWLLRGLDRVTARP